MEYYFASVKWALKNVSFLLSNTGYLGGATLHSMMTPHGPDADCFKDWSETARGAIKVN